LNTLRIANRKREFEFFDAMLTGKCPERILLVRAPSESGKSVLLAEFAMHAEVRLGSSACARVNLKGKPPLAAVLDRICIDLGRDSFPKFCSGGAAVPIQVHAELRGAKLRDENVVTVAPHIYQAGAPSSLTLASSLIADLSVHANPRVLIIDTFEQATAETSNWIVQQLLPLVHNIHRFWIVIAGKIIPAAVEYPMEWGGLAKSHELLPVTSADDWHEYACQRYPDFPRNDLEVVCRGFASRPSLIEEFIRVIGSQLVGSRGEVLL
jgi:hypothetical protein